MLATTLDRTDILLGRLPPQRPNDHRTELELGAHPTVQRQFRVTQLELDELRNQLDYLLEKNFIYPSSSPFAQPITVHTEKRRGISHVHGLSCTEPSYHQVLLPHPARRRTD
ncbi:unnamed protein product [Closterium sp. NIES-54]